MAPSTVLLLLQFRLDHGERVLDPGTVLAITLTMLVSFSVNIMAVYGVVQAKIAWIFPFLVLYMGFIIECCLAITFNLISNLTMRIGTKSYLFHFSISRYDFASFYLFGFFPHWMDPHEDNFGWDGKLSSNQRWKREVMWDHINISVQRTSINIQSRVKRNIWIEVQHTVQLLRSRSSENQHLKNLYPA